MEIDLNREESTEINIFIKFSIREYVAEIRKTNPVKCWPFGSLRDTDNKVVSSYQSPESPFLSGKNCPCNINGSDDTTKLTEAPNLSKVENFSGKEDRPETTNDMLESVGVHRNIGKVVCNGSSELTFCKVNNGQNRLENNVDEGAKIRHNEAADNNEPGRNQLRRKPHRSRLVSDIYKDPASELRAGCDITNPEIVNKRFVAEVEDDSDDVTLAAYFRKQRSVDITDSILNKKRDITAVESVDQEKKSNHGSKDSIRKDSNVGTTRKKRRTDDTITDTQTMLEHKKDFRLQCNQKSNPFAVISGKEEAAEKENEDSELEAVMLLARHFNKQKQILDELETKPTCVCANKKIQEHSTQYGNRTVTKTSSKTATKHLVKKVPNKKLESAFCSVQRKCFIPAKATTDGAFQSHVEMSKMKAAGVRPDAQNCATLVCSFNRNPADFSTPNGEHKFMRGG